MRHASADRWTNDTNAAATRSSEEASMSVREVGTLPVVVMLG